MKDIKTFFYNSKIQIPSKVSIKIHKKIETESNYQDQQYSTIDSIESTGRIHEVKKSNEKLSAYCNSTFDKVEILHLTRFNEFCNPFVLLFEGPLGSIQIDIQKIDSNGLVFFRIDLQKNEFEIFVKKTRKNSKSFFGSILSLCQNAFHGVSQGYLIYLELIGVGFRALIHESEFKIQKIEFKIGQSHDIFYEIPKNIHVFSIKPNLFCLYSLDKQKVTHFAAKLRNLKSPEPYKGKGIRKRDEIIQIKVGKKK